MQTKINEALEGKKFFYKNETFAFLSCKRVSSNMMILTDKRALQIPFDRADDFLSEIAIQDNPEPSESTELAMVRPSAPERPVRTLYFPNENPLFDKVNSGISNLLTELDHARDNDDYSRLEKKAKMLTSIGQTVVNIETTKLNILRAYNNI